MNYGFAFLAQLADSYKFNVLGPFFWDLSAEIVMEIDIAKV